MTEEFCRIWALERNKFNGSAHYCHAEAKGLGGALYAKSVVPQKLKETSTLGDSRNWEWRLRACEPDGGPSRSEQCEGCVFKPYSGIKHMWGIR